MSRLILECLIVFACTLSNALADNSTKAYVTVTDRPSDPAYASEMNCTLTNKKDCLQGGVCRIVKGGEVKCFCPTDGIYIGDRCQQKKSCDTYLITVRKEEKMESDDLQHSQVFGDNVVNKKVYTNPDCVLKEKILFKAKKNFGFTLADYTVDVCMYGYNATLKLYAGDSEDKETLTKTFTLGLKLPSTNCQPTFTVESYKLLAVVERKVVAKEYQFNVKAKIDIGGLRTGAIIAIIAMAVLIFGTILLVVLIHLARNKDTR